MAGTTKYKVLPEYLGNDSKVFFNRRGIDILIPCDFMTQEDMQDLLAACGGSHPILVEDKKAPSV